MIQIGRVCVKLAGRDAGKRCAIIDILDKNTVLIEGETRRRKCNILHLELMEEVITVEKNASHEKVCKALGIEPKEKKPKNKTERPKRERKKKMIKDAEALEAKAAKKEKPKKEPAKKTKETKIKAEKTEKKETKTE